MTNQQLNETFALYLTLGRPGQHVIGDQEFAALAEYLRDVGALMSLLGDSSTRIRLLRCAEDIERTLELRRRH